MAETMKETPKAKEACEQYLLLGPERSLAKLAEAMGKRPGYVQVLKEWSSAHKWQEKAREYDKEQAEKRRLEHQSRIEKMNEEHFLLGRTQALRAVTLIGKLIEREEIRDTALVQYFKAATSLQRLAAGAATEQLAITGKDEGPLDVVVETFWGRGTDPRRRLPEIDDAAKIIDEDQGDDDEGDEEYGIDVPDDDED